MQATTATALALALATMARAGCLGADGTETQGTQRDPETNTRATGSRGALTGTDGAADANATAAPGREARLDGCVMHLALVGIPEELADPPDGWGTSPFQGIPGLIEAFLAASACASGEGTEGGWAEVRWIVAGIIVDPPAAYEGPEVEALLAGSYAESDGFVAELHAWGIHDIAPSTISFLDHGGPGARAGLVETMDGDFGVRIETLVPDSPFDLGSDGIRLFAFNGSNVTGLDVTWRNATFLGPGEAMISVGDLGLPIPPVPPGLATHAVGAFSFGLEAVALPPLDGADTNGSRPLLPRLG